MYTFLSPHLVTWTWASQSHSVRSLFRFSEWNFAILDGSPGMLQKVPISTIMDNKIPPKKCKKEWSTSEFTIPTRLPACRTLVNGGVQQFICWNPKIQTRIWRTIIFLLKSFSEIWNLSLNSFSWNPDQYLNNYHLSSLLLLTCLASFVG